MEKYITILNYDVDVDRLVSMANKLEDKWEQSYIMKYKGADSELDRVEGLNHWQQNMQVDKNDKYIKRILEDFELLPNSAMPKFHWLAPNSVLETHVDERTKCSLNFLLSPDLAPVTFDDKHSFNYNQALLNTKAPHGVKNGPHERLLFRISYHDETYEELSNRIKYKANGGPSSPPYWKN
jgi:hypothetical protein